MQVVIETNALFTTQAGVARYIRGLLKGLKRISPADIEWTELAWEVENFGYRQPERALKTLWRELWWANGPARRQIQAREARLLHHTFNCMVPAPQGVRQALTLHDLAFLEFPERFRRWSRWRWSRLLERIRSVDRIICISRFTAEEAHRLLDLPFKRMDVIYNGCEFHPEEGEIRETRPGFEAPAGFFLFVGSLEPGKNLSLIKEMYKLAEARSVVLPPLLIVGARWEGVAGEGPPPKGWTYLGHQPDEVLVYLYRRALALLFPSKYEGFGLPIAEAMALGCPVICARVASLPEVGGDAALYAELCPESFMKAAQELLHSRGKREELVSRGAEQAAKFSWSRCASEVAEVYRLVMAGG